MNTLVALFTFILTCTTVVTSALSADSNSIQIGSKTYAFHGKRITKEGLVHIATIQNAEPQFSERQTFFPGGVVILVTKRCVRHNKNNWCLSVTEDGLAFYVRVDGSGYRKIEPEEPSAYIIQQFTLKRDGANDLNFGPGEVYNVANANNNNVEIALAEGSFKDNFPADTVLNVSDFSDKLAIVEPANFEIPDAIPLLAPLEIASMLEGLFDDLELRRLNKAKREKLVRELMSTRLIARKLCRQRVAFGTELEGSLQADTGKFLRALGIKLGISGSFASETEFPVGYEFQTTRLSQTGETGSADIYEIWTERRRVEDNCNKQTSSSEIRISVSDGAGRREASINSAALENAGFQSSVSSKNVVYSCPEQYRKLMDLLTNLDGTLEPNEARVVAFYLTKYDPPDSKKTCE